MTPTIPHVLLTVHGAMPGGESWSSGVRSLAWATDLGATKGNALAVAVANRWRALGNLPTTGMLLGNASVLVPLAVSGVTVRRINETGLTVEQFEGAPTTAVVPTGNSQTSWPNQCAVVVSLLTNRAGRTGKGRMYLPAMANPGFTDGQIPSATCTTIASNVKALLDGVNTDLHTATDAANFLAVQSAVASAEPGAWTVGAPSGYMGARITQIRVGSVVDTQQRRKKSLIESYASAVLA